MPDPAPAYDYWDAWRSRVSSTGVAMMPVAGPAPQPSVPILLNGGAEYDMVTFTARRWGGPPIIPSPVLNSPNRVLIGGGQSACYPLPVWGTTRLWAVDGWYLWGIINPEGLISDMPLGTPPMNGTDGPLDFNQYLRLATGNLLNRQLTTDPTTTPMPTGDNSQPEQIPQLFRVITQKW